MAADFSWLLDALKLSTRFILPVVIALAVCLFAPQGFIESIGLKSLREQHQPYLGGAFLLSSCVLVSRGLIHACTWAREQYRQRSRLLQARAALHHLTPEEQALLRGYLERHTKTANLFLSSGVVGGLTRLGIIYCSTNHGRGHDPRFDHNISDWAWDYLHDHPELIGLTCEQVQPARIER